MVELVEATAVSQKGRNRIAEHGNVWKVRRHENHVQALSGRGGTLIEAADGYLRWVADDNDPHLRIKQLFVK